MTGQPHEMNAPTLREESITINKVNTQFRIRSACLFAAITACNMVLAIQQAVAGRDHQWNALALMVATAIFAALTIYWLGETIKAVIEGLALRLDHGSCRPEVASNRARLGRDTP